jgi:serine-type D-Ala-D-Ala carboxypeptidase/endopeptidase
VPAPAIASTGRRRTPWAICAGLALLPILIAPAPAAVEVTPARAVDDAVAVSMRTGTCHGLAVGVLRNGARTDRFYGSAGREAPDARTEFAIGSITKTFTAMLLAWANSQGLLKLDDQLSMYSPPGAVVPSFRGTPITLATLAEHTSGLDSDLPYWAPELPESALWTFVSKSSLSYAPGTVYLYSNVSYGVLGSVMARKTATPLAELYARVITGPLGMQDTVIALAPEQKARLAVGYGETGRPTSEEWLQFPALEAAGGLNSTLDDMMRYLAYQLGETETPLNALRPVMHKARIRVDARTGFALGWQLRTLRDGTEIVEHPGAVPGFSSHMAFAPALRTGVVILASQENCAVTKVGSQIMTVLLKTPAAVATREAALGTVRHNGRRRPVHIGK